MKTKKTYFFRLGVLHLKESQWTVITKVVDEGDA